MMTSSGTNLLLVLGLVLVSCSALSVEYNRRNGRRTALRAPTTTQLQHPGDIMSVSTEWLPDPRTGCFYKIVSRPMLGWTAARESCARFADGADLASITDESELQLLSNVATEHQLEVSECRFGTWNTLVVVDAMLQAGVHWAPPPPIPPPTHTHHISPTSHPPLRHRTRTL
jgi:hypothetical protein